jgi:hypothetical protein
LTRRPVAVARLGGSTHNLHLDEASAVACPDRALQPASPALPERRTFSVGRRIGTTRRQRLSGRIGWTVPLAQSRPERSCAGSGALVATRRKGAERDGIRTCRHAHPRFAVGDGNHNTVGAGPPGGSAVASIRKPLARALGRSHAARHPAISDGQGESQAPLRVSATQVRAPHRIAATPSMQPVQNATCDDARLLHST